MKFASKNISYRKMFLIDAIGALMSSFFLGILLVKYEKYFGMPVGILYILSSIAILFFMYSTICYLSIKTHRHPYLVSIAYANLAYCILTVSMTIYFFDPLTKPGVIYFVVEALVILVIVYLELKVAYQ